MKKGAIITPWEIEGKVDYARLIKEFGIQQMLNLPAVFNKELLFRRKIIFGQRDFGRILDAIKNRKKFAMMTGLMPSGKFHLGHMLLVQQMIFYQKLGAKLYIAVADLEAYNTRQKNLKELRNIAMEEYLSNYIALGLKSKNCEFYFQSERSNNAKKSNAYYRLASNFSRYATFNEFKAIYGEISPGKMNASLLQAADILHCQLPEFEGKPLPVLIPVGIDQDPHLRLARDISQRYKDYRFIPPSSTYNLFFPGLKGNGKMSSSDETSFIGMTDTEKEIENKIKKYAFSGGKDTIEEHRKQGGNPNIDVSFQYLKFFFEPDDKKLQKIYEDYKSGKLLTSELKAILIEKINSFLKKHQMKKKYVNKQVKKFLSKLD
ncbi:MAG: tryptophan--tRNA ligase [Candidatus Pacearchaeota archaeon]|nr:tryptophan--tRNA ligase [Candidatus Pacearchaeota archaeon]